MATCADESRRRRVDRVAGFDSEGRYWIAETNGRGIRYRNRGGMGMSTVRGGDGGRCYCWSPSPWDFSAAAGNGGSSDAIGRPWRRSRRRSRPAGTGRPCGRYSHSWLGVPTRMRPSTYWGLARCRKAEPRRPTRPGPGSRRFLGSRPVRSWVACSSARNAGGSPRRSRSYETRWLILGSMHPAYPSRSGPSGACKAAWRRPCDSSRHAGKSWIGRVKGIRSLRSIWPVDHIELRRSPIPVETVRSSLDQAEQLVPGDDRVWLGKANLAIRVGSYEEASRWLDACLRRRPEDVPVWRARLNLAVATDRDAVAREALKHLPAEESTPAEIAGLAAWLAARRGDLAGERRALEQAIAVDPSGFAALDRLTDLAVQEGRPEHRRRAANPEDRDRSGPGSLCETLSTQSTDARLRRDGEPGGTARAQV